MSLTTKFPPVQAAFIPPAGIQIAHYGLKIGYLAQFLAERDYSDSSRARILEHAGMWNAVQDPYCPVWRRPCDQLEAAGMLQKGINEVRTRQLWRDRNADRMDGPFAARGTFEDAILDSTL